MFALRIERDKHLESGWSNRVLSRPVFPHRSIERQNSWSDESALIVSSDDPAGGGIARIAECRESGAIALIWGSIFDRPSLQAKLGYQPSSQAELALSAWRKWGPGCCDHLVGEFSLAIYDPKSRRVFALRDAMGIRPLYFADLGSKLLISTSIPPLKALADRPFDISDSWLAEFISGISMSSERTPFAEICKVPPGHYLLSRGSELTLRRYHHFDVSSPASPERSPAVLEGYRAVLEQVVAERFERPDPIGVEISGGIDSSTIAGFAPRLTPDPDTMLHGFGYVTSEDEPAAILGVSRHAGLRNNHLFTSFEVGRASTQRGIEVLGHPAEHGNAVGHIPFFRLAKTLGVRTLFSGFGGDEGVTNYANSHRRDLLHTRQYRALWNVLPGNAVTKSLRMGKALTTNRHRAEYVDRFLTGARRRLQDSILLQDVKQDINLEPRILESARWDAPYDTLNEFVVGMLSKAFVSTRTESCSLVSASYGIEYSWPLLDPRLIQQWLAAPTIEKVHPTMGRYLHRRAIEGIVLDRVRLQPSKFMGSALPNSGGQQIVAEQKGDVTELRDGLSSRLASLINEERLGAVVERYVGRQATGERSPVDSRTLYSVLAAQHWLTQEISEGLK